MDRSITAYAAEHNIDLNNCTLSNVIELHHIQPPYAISTWESRDYVAKHDYPLAESIRVDIEDLISFTVTIHYSDKSFKCFGTFFNVGELTKNFPDIFVFKGTYSSFS